MITADQLVAHAVGDYILQSDWMASEKVKRSIAALAHVATYGLPFLFLRPTLAAYAVIVGTHFVIDRWRLARYVCWVKNLLGPWRSDMIQPRRADGRVSVVAPYKREWVAPTAPWSECRATGYGPEKPAWMAVWLLIITDNTMHVLCNGAALRWLT